MLLWFLTAGLLAASAQLPDAAKLSEDDWREFRAEVRRLEGLVDTANDRPTVMYALARTWASGGQYREAMDWLGKAVALNVGLDPSSDSVFAALRNTTEFRGLVEKIRETTPPVLHSTLAFEVAEPELFPEGIAWDSRGRQFFLGSTLHRKIIRCNVAGACATFAAEGGLSQVLGMKVDARTNTLWAASNGATESGLFRYDVTSGRLLAKFTVNGTKGAHEFNDLVVTRHGDVFVTDTRGGTVYRADHGTGTLEPFAGRLTAPNGIAVSDDERRLYVAEFGDGITVIDIATRRAQPIAHPADLCLATIDGLYFYNGSLIAIQNGVMVHRVVRYHLTRAGDGIERFEVLERRNPKFAGITTGAVAEGYFYYMANTQLDRVADGKVTPGAVDPVTVLRVALR